MRSSYLSLLLKAAAPALFLLVSILAYGLQAPFMGYYLDDWIILHAYNIGGIERVFEYAFLGNRPLVAWMWWIGFKLCASSPIAWQIWALFWRWATVVMVWLVFRRLWPNATRQGILVALLFAVYPLFKQQSSALTYSFHWMAFFLYALSLYLMVLSVQRPRHFYPLMLGAFVTGFVQLFSQEFYVGLELLRPLVLWTVLKPCIPEWKNQIRRISFYWAPYFIMFCGYVVWRVKLMPTNGSDRNAPDLLMGLVTTPAASLVKLAEMFFQSNVEILVGVWYKAFQPDLFVARPISNLFVWAMVIALTIFLWVVFSRISFQKRYGEEPASGGSWLTTAIPLGVAAMLLGFAPGWAIGSYIYDKSGIYNDRFGLAAGLGAALLLVALLELLLRKESYFIALVCLMIGLGVGQNFRFATDYRWSWEKQRQLYWQLKWRAPDIEPQTAIVGDGALISYMGSWATISALNQMYAPDKNVHEMDYWYIDLQKINDLTPFIHGEQAFQDEKNFMRYSAPANHSLTIAFEPENLQCLWVVSEEDRFNPYLSDSVRDGMRLTDLSRIKESEKTLRLDIFSPEVPRDWCYFFQKADLARQMQDWDEVIRIYQRAEAVSERPKVSVEYRPFIEAFAHKGDWQAALDVTKKAFFPDYEMRSYLCATWRGIRDTTADTPERAAALEHIANDFACSADLDP